MQPWPERRAIPGHSSASEELLCSGFAGSFVLDYVPLIRRFARHIFELELPQFLELPDLFGGKLTAYIYRVVSV